MNQICVYNINAAFCNNSSCINKCQKFLTNEIKEKIGNKNLLVVTFECNVEFKEL